MVGTAFLSIGIETALAQRFEPSCKTFTHRYFLSAGSAIPLRVGFVDTSLTICRRSDGFIESADAGQTAGTTGPGTAAGFVVEPSLAVVTEQRGATAKSKYEGRVRVCLAQRTPICSESHDYTIFAHFSPVGPTTRDRTQPEWSHAEETPGGVHYHELLTSSAECSTGCGRSGHSTPQSSARARSSSACSGHLAARAMPG
jgi:hypothetical protein